MCKYELPISRLSKVIVRQTHIQTDRLTDRTKIIYHAASQVVKYVFLSCHKAVTSEIVNPESGRKMLSINHSYYYSYQY